MSEQDPTPSELFADFLAQSGGDLESLCAAHPEMADRLRRLHEDVENMRGFLRRAGSVGPPTEALEGAQPGSDPGIDPGSAPSPLLERLRRRTGQYDRYRLDSEIGRGGQGEVRRVWDEDFRRNLAMKVLLGAGRARLLQQPQDPRKVSRFLEEAQVTGQLDHPGIVPVHEIGLDPQGDVYFTMKLVEGDNLGVIFQKVHEPGGEWGLMRAIAVLLKVCEAVSFAHSRGVVHRDLKPANIMVGPYGEVYVMDWGLARLMDADGKGEAGGPSPGASGLREVRSERRDLVNEEAESPLRTVDGAVVGTPAFMSPEQARGELESVGPRSDVYSIGAMLYELLTGKRPHGSLREGGQGKRRALLRDGPPRPIERLVKGVPAELVAICEKAMAPDKEDRYASVADLRLDLQAFVGGRVVRAYRTGAVVELVKWVKRNRVLAAASILVGLLVFGGLFAWNAAERERVKEVEQQRREATLAAEAARWQSHVANLRTAAWNLESENYAEAQRRLDACPAEHRGWEWRHLSLRMDQSIHAFSAHPSAVTALAFDPSGGELLSGSSDGSVRLWSAADGAPRRAFEARGGAVLSLVPGPASGPRWSAAGDGSLRVWSAMGELTAVHREASPVGAVHAAVPGTSLWISVGEGAQTGSRANVHLVQADGTEVWARRVEDALPVVAAGPAGEHILVGGGSRAYLYGRRSGNLLASEPLPSPVAAAAFDPRGGEGGRVALGLADGRLLLWEFEKSGLRMASRLDEVDLASDSSIGCLAFSPDGGQLVVGLDSGRLALVDTASGRAERDLLGHTSPVLSLAFAADGGRLASGDQSGVVRLWLGAGAAVVSHFDSVRDEGLSNVQVDRASSRVVGRRAGVVRIWEAADGSPVARLDGRASAFDPESGRVFLVDDGEGGRLVDSVDGSDIATLRWESGEVVALNLAPGGERVALAFADGSIRLQALGGTSRRIAAPGTLTGVEDLQFSPDGSRLVARNYRTLVAFDVARGEEVARHGLTDSDATYFSFACDPLGRYVAFTTLARDRPGDRRCGSLGILDLEDGALAMLVPERRVFAKDALPTPDSIAFRPDGGCLASGFADGSLRLWARGTWEATILQGPAEVWRGITFSPTGDRIWARKSDPTGIGVFDPDHGEWLLTLPVAGGRLDDLAYDAVHDRLLLTSDNSALLSLDGVLDQARTLWAAGARRGALDSSIETWEEHTLLGMDVERVRRDPDLAPEQRETLAARVEWIGDPDADALNDQAWAAVDPDGEGRGGSERALRNARTAVRLDPKRPEYRETLAWALFRNQRYDEALAEARAAVDNAPPEEKASYRETLLELRNRMPD